MASEPARNEVARYWHHAAVDGVDLLRARVVRRVLAEVTQEAAAAFDG